MLNLYLSMIDTQEDIDRFTQLYEANKHFMFRVANQIMHDEHLAEDAVQEAFFRIAKNFHKVDSIDSLRTKKFLSIITRNVAITMCKQNYTVDNIDDYSNLSLMRSDDSTFESIEYQIIAEGILSLPEKYRDSIYLYHIYGYSFNEMAALLNVSSEALKKRAQRARIMLKQYLKKEGFLYE